MTKEIGDYILHNFIYMKKKKLIIAVEREKKKKKKEILFWEVFFHTSAVHVTAWQWSSWEKMTN